MSKEVVTTAQVLETRTAGQVQTCLQEKWRYWQCMNLAKGYYNQLKFSSAELTAAKCHQNYADDYLKCARLFQKQ